MRRWWYTLVDAPRALGRPQPAHEWDADYDSGRWDGLESAAQVAHYAVIAGYIQHLYPQGAAVIDAGCGHGVLFRQLQCSPLRSYVGFDHSASAIARATPMATDRARFEVADFESWHPREHADVVVFNESIGYARHPLAVIERYVRMLTAGGSIVVSTCMNAMNREIAKRIRRDFGGVHRTRVQNERGERWEINLLRPGDRRP